MNAWTWPFAALRICRRVPHHCQKKFPNKPAGTATNAMVYPACDAVIPCSRINTVGSQIAIVVLNALLMPVRLNSGPRKRRRLRGSRDRHAKSVAKQVIDNVMKVTRALASKRISEFCASSLGFGRGGSAEQSIPMPRQIEGGRPHQQRSIRNPRD